MRTLCAKGTNIGATTNAPKSTPGIIAKADHWPIPTINPQSNAIVGVTITLMIIARLPRADRLSSLSSPCVM